jgi:hypothetical protein
MIAIASTEKGANRIIRRGYADPALGKATSLFASDAERYTTATPVSKKGHISHFVNRYRSGAISKCYKTLVFSRGDAKRFYQRAPTLWEIPRHIEMDCLKTVGARIGNNFSVDGMLDVNSCAARPAFTSIGQHTPKIIDTSDRPAWTKIRQTSW